MSGNSQNSAQQFPPLLPLPATVSLQWDSAADKIKDSYSVQPPTPQNEFVLEEPITNR